MLRFQQYIELVRSQSPSKLSEAISHAKKHLIPYRTTFEHEVQQTCGLLALPPSSPASVVYAELYNPERWTTLADLFTSTHNQLLALPPVPLLHVALSSGLSALKTPACHSSSHHVGEGNTNTTTTLRPSSLGQGVCPICSTELNELARNVPYAHHTKSHVEHDLRLLPNGNVYGKERLQEAATKAALPPDHVKDLRNGDVFHVNELKKVYIT